MHFQRGDVLRSDVSLAKVYCKSMSSVADSGRMQVIALNVGETGGAKFIADSDRHFQMDCWRLGVICPPNDAIGAGKLYKSRDCH
jgi:hypothetical protein